MPLLRRDSYLRASSIKQYNKRDLSMPLLRPG